MIAMERARDSGRGFSVFRPAEAAAFLGCNRAVVDAAMREYIESSGRRGLAFSLLGKGRLIRREALDQWMISQEMAIIGKA